MNHLIKIVQYENIDLNAGKVDENKISLPANNMKIKRQSFVSAVNPVLPITGASIKTAIREKHSYVNVVEESLSLGQSTVADTDTVNFGFGTLTYEVTIANEIVPSEKKSADLKRLQKNNQFKIASKASIVMSSSKLAASVTPGTGITGSIETATGSTGSTGTTPKVPRKKTVKGGTTVTPATATATGTTGA